MFPKGGQAQDSMPAPEALGWSSNEGPPLAFVPKFHLFASTNMSEPYPQAGLAGLAGLVEARCSSCPHSNYRQARVSPANKNKAAGGRGGLAGPSSPVSYSSDLELRGQDEQKVGFGKLPKLWSSKFQDQHHGLQHLKAPALELTAPAVSKVGFVVSKQPKVLHRLSHNSLILSFAGQHKLLVSEDPFDSVGRARRNHRPLPLWFPPTPH